MEVTGMNHFTVLTKNLASSVQFYAQTLWLSKGPRPDYRSLAHGCTATVGRSCI
ncbi:hypothetical protein [Cupriavidus oxalaticus]|uniref:hypothetical protein n=1 Tax=Cupriavidus oxalaticus TaxID=96344 RepID=UPI00143840F2|nr:hypothetical protein [Cupriavidus oxalaticus]